MKTKTKFTLNEVLSTLKKNKLERNDYKLLYENFETEISKDGYMKFRLTEKDKWKNVHTLVNQYFNLEEHDKKHKELIETNIERCLVTHHINFFEKENKLNNHPDNLQWLGWDEHRILHNEIMCEVVDKMWNPENSEYNNYEEQRKKIIQAGTNTLIKFKDKLWNENNPEYEEYYEIRKEEKERLSKNGKNTIVEHNKELWYGENSIEFRKKMKLVVKSTEESIKELWHGEENEKHREKMKPIQSENAKNMSNYYWYGEGNENRREDKKKQLNELWYGEGNEKYREKNKNQITKMTYELWHGEGNEKYREKNLEHLKKINSNPENNKKSLETKVFKIFDRILENNEQITDESYFEYKKHKKAPFLKTVFDSIEIAIDKYKDYPIK